MMKLRAVATAMLAAILVLGSMGSAGAADDEPTGVSVRDEPIAVTVNAERGVGFDETCTEINESETVCVTIGASAPPASVEGAPTTKAIVALPAWCLDAGVANTFWATRTQMCGIFDGVLTVHQTVNGVPGPVTGTMNFLMYNYIYTSTSATTWANQMQVSPTTIVGTAAGTQISGTASCVGFCTPVSSTFPVQTPIVHASANGESYFQWLGTAGQVGTSTTNWTLSFKAPSAATPALLLRNAPQTRCDHATPGRTMAGCVVPSVTPWIEYSASVFPDFAAHVYTAQTSGLPGSATPLHRLTDSTLVAANRNTACPASLPRPTGMSCDEYPFASSYEGAALSGGGPRTQSWCSVTLSGPPSTGALGYSVCMIDATENSTAGSLLNSLLYSPYRIIDGDPYYVDIVF